jgi:hypothetical protein
MKEVPFFLDEKSKINPIFDAKPSHRAITNHPYIYVHALPPLWIRLCPFTS